MTPTTILMVLLSLTLIVLVGGCIPFSATPPPPVLFSIPITMFIIRIWPGFSQDKITHRITLAKELFERYGLKLSFKGQRDHFANPAWEVVTEEDLPHLQRYASQISQPQATFCVKSITFKGKPAGGFGYLHGVSCIADGSCDTVAGHELGHVLGLTHTEDPNNLMSKSTCGAFNLTPTQVETIKQSLTDYSSPNSRPKISEIWVC